MTVVDVGRWFAHLRAAHGDDLLALARLQSAPAGSQQIVALGTSRSLYAFDYDDIFAQRIDAHPSPAHFTRISILSGYWLELEPALEALDAHPPRLLLIESDLFGYEHLDRNRVRENLRQLSAAVRWRLRRAFGLSPEFELDREQNLGEEQFYSARDCANNLTPEVVGEYFDKLRVPTPQRLQRQLALVKHLQQAGTRVVLIDLPRAEVARHPTPSTDYRPFENKIDEIARHNGFERWQAPTLPERTFCDRAHLNAEGRALTSDWLARRIEAMQASGG